MLEKTVQYRASDLHITAGVPAVLRIDGKLRKIDDNILKPVDTHALMTQLSTEEQRHILDMKGQVDLSFSQPGLGRFRVNIYKQRNSYSLALRVLSTTIPAIEELGLPSVVKDLAMKQRGLVLVTGPTGSGKSTTLASMIDYINKNDSRHVMTLEDPIEYLHRHERCMVNQREIGTDSNSFADALRAALRQDPDVILVGEMRDLETISIAITAAETGHLVFSTLHTVGAAKTMDRIIDVFPTHQQQQVKIQLSTVVEGIISQQLIPTVDEKGRVGAFEIMMATPAIRNLIREGKSHQILSIMQTGGKFGMRTMDGSLSELALRGIISFEDALAHCVDRETMERLLRN